MPQITIEIKRSVVERFKAEAKRAWPRESFAHLLGHNAGDLVIVEDLFIPDDVDAHCTTNAVFAQHYWAGEALAQAREEDMAVVGDIHSHPRPFGVWNGQITERIPSEGDHADGWQGMCGICVVSEQKDGRLRASVRFYGPSYKVETKLI